MGKKSVRENKNMFFRCREDLNLTREEASELLGCISADKIEKIENERILPQPEDVEIMAEKYGAPLLRNYYCSKICSLGQKYVPQVKVKDLSQITLDMLATLISLNRDRDRLVEITVDGKVSDDELEEFIKIRENLNSMQDAIDSLSAWVDMTMKADK